MCLIRRKEGEYVRRITEAGRCGVERRLLAVSIEMPVTAAVLGAAVFYVIRPKSELFRDLLPLLNSSCHAMIAFKAKS